MTDSIDGVELLDINAMLGRLPTEDVGDGSVAQLCAELDRFGIGSAVVSHTSASLHDPPTGNRRLVADIGDEPRLLPCWVGLPDTCDELGGVDRFLTEAAQAGVRTVRLFPTDHGYPLVGDDIDPLLAALATVRVPVLIDADQASWPEIEQVARAHPELPLVVCRVGYRALRAMSGVLNRTHNVHIDLSYLGSHLGLEWLVDRFGADRVLFGTGAPGRDRADAVTRLLWSELDDPTVRAIGAGNARHLFGGTTW